MVKFFKNALAHNQYLVVVLLLGMIMTLGAILRIYDLGAESYWTDEVLMLQRAELEVGQLIYQRVGPLFKIVAHYWQRSFGNTEVATRSLPALAGIAAIPLMYLVGRDLFGSRAGLISALLIAISGFQILHSQNYRYYSLVVLLTLLSYFFYIRFLKNGRVSDSVLYVILSILLFYTHNFALFVLISQGLYFVLRWKHYDHLRARWILTQVGVLLGIAPGLLYIAWLSQIGYAAGSLESELPAFGRERVPTLWTLPVTLGVYMFASPSSVGVDWLAVLLGMAFLVTGTLLLIKRQGSTGWLASIKGLAGNMTNLWNDKQDEVLLVALWLLCPIIMLFVLSKVVSPVYTHRYTISASAAFYLLLAVSITATAKVVPPYISVGAIVILSMFGLRDYYVNAITPPWRDIAANMIENSTPEDGLLYDALQKRTSFEWYYRDPSLSICADVYPQIKRDKAIAAIERCAAQYKRIWLITRGPEQVTVLERVFLNPNLSKVHLISEEHFSSRWSISVYLFEVDQATLTTEVNSLYQ